MDREILDIAGRCVKCGMAVGFLVKHTGMTYGGEPWTAIETEYVQHTRSDCEQMVTLQREQWPTLW